jgi:CRISPR-associated endonuclease Cas2
MPNPKKTEIKLIERLRRLKQAGLGNPQPPGTIAADELPLEDMPERLKKILQLFEQHKKTSKMIFFVMYDIENNKVRTQIAKYLIKKGCTRVQKSIFLAELDRALYNEIHQTLKEVQEVYENNDSIFFVPVSTDEIRAMKVIGHSVDFDLITGNRNTLFF